MTFVTVMAEACRAALGGLAAGPMPERRAALGFLRRLSEFRTLIQSMSVDKYRRMREGSLAGVGAMRNWQVSEAGEVLIARSFGVIEAFDAWLARHPEFILAER